MVRYVSATLHPWASLVFLAPLMIVYEGGILASRHAAQPIERSGADEWLRLGLHQYGLGQAWAAPVLVIAILAAWSWWAWKTRPPETVATAFGMLLESVVFAAILWVFAQNFGLLLQAWDVPPAAISFRSPATAQVVRYVGAGIYEEVLFRLGLFSVAVLLLRLTLLPKVAAVLIAGVGGSLLFAYVHHVGPQAEPMDAGRFLFRTLAGLYFTALYVTRGFGVTVGTHAGFDVLVGVAVG